MKKVLFILMVSLMLISCGQKEYYTDAEVRTFIAMGVAEPVDTVELSYNYDTYRLPIVIVGSNGYYPSIDIDGNVKYVIAKLWETN